MSDLQIIKPYARIMPPAGSPTTDFTREDGIALLRRVEFCARVSHRSEEAISENSFDRFLRSIILNHADWSVAEHASVSVDFYVDRGITHELVRHRHFAFTQESTRFVNYEKKMPPSFVQPEFGGEASLCVFRRLIGQAETAYRELISLGNPPQIARAVFPNALASRIIITGNLRSWRHFFLMRTSRESHPQMREVTIPLLAEFKEKIPIFFEDVEPMASQAENLKKTE